VKATYINELTEGSRVNGTYFLRARDLRAARSGDAYLTMELSDKTGSIGAVLFRPTPDVTAVPTGTAVDVRGVVTSYRGVRRVSVDSLMPARHWEPATLVGEGPRPADELLDELRRIWRGVSEPGLRRTLRNVFSDEAFIVRFRTCPASQAYHHAYVGGLLEHTVAVASLCAELAPRYDGVDAPLLVAAALLHDIGKVDELTFDAGIGYTDEGRLTGHVVLGAMRVREAARKARLDRQTMLRLEHAILSHHGELEWGSPKRPSTLEALLLHHVDNLDAKAAGFASLLKGATSIQENWTDAANLFRRPLYAPRSAEDDRPHRPAEDESYFRASA
jgi:3'-5' exoribonuclease